MNIFLIYVRDEDYYRELPEELGGSTPADEQVKVMAFPPLGIETLAPVVRQHGHRVRMFDTCHPQMKSQHIAQAVEQEQPDVIALSFLSTTTYPPVKSFKIYTAFMEAKTPPKMIGVFGATFLSRFVKDLTGG